MEIVVVPILPPPSALEDVSSAEGLSSTGGVATRALAASPVAMTENTTIRGTRPLWLNIPEIAGLQYTLR